MSINLRMPNQPTRPPRCGGSHSSTRKCLMPLLLTAYDIDEKGRPTGDPTWWCPTHHERSDPHRLAPPPEGITAAIAQRSSATPTITLATTSYRDIVL